MGEHHKMKRSGQEQINITGSAGTAGSPENSGCGGRGGKPGQVSRPLMPPQTCGPCAAPYSPK